jgi:hypothetical protein
MRSGCELLQTLKQKWGVSFEFFQNFNTKSRLNVWNRQSQKKGFEETIQTSKASQYQAQQNKEQKLVF